MRYFFDVETKYKFITDKIGSEETTLESVRRIAIASLPLIAADDLPNGDEYFASVYVRNENDDRIFTATMNVKANWSHGYPNIQ
ncbi:hypothetical protein [Fulvimarina sp. MAC8]|uniref:DUF6894 family protein n=1 Tax=Fulvimarina sp. MAC8 TaxID=3162874 RepID=UPI0032ECDDEA